MNALTTTERMCSHCGQSKLESQFSLVKGVHSDLRKLICVKCELKARESRKYGISLEQLESALNCPCIVCGEKSKKLNTNKIKGVVLGAFCNRCWTLIKSITSPEQGEEIAIRVQNYFVMKKCFPFLLVSLIDNNITDSDLPLLNFIESNDRNK